MVKGDKGPTGKMKQFEDEAVYITPWDPVYKNHNTNSKCSASEITNTSSGGAQVSATRANQGRGYTGVEFHYYKYD